VVFKSFLKGDLLPLAVKVLTIILVFVVIGSIGAVFGLIFISPRGDIVKVPNVVGKTFDEAFDILSERNLNVKKSIRPDETIPPGYVISQSPDPDTKVRAGRRVEVVVSEGSVRIEVIDFRGKNFFEAQNILVKTKYGIMSGLQFGDISYVYHDTIPKDHIISQTPIPGKKVTAATKINLLVSKGPPPVAVFVPRVLNLNLDAACKKIEEVGLLIGKVERCVDDTLTDGIVVAQDPPARYLVERGDRVNLVVSQKSKDYKRITPRFHIVRYKVPNGAYFRHVRIIVVDERGQETVFDKKIESGKEVKTIVQVIGLAKAMIYLDGELIEERMLR
jgi:serine/threonine-protein kinase